MLVVFVNYCIYEQRVVVVMRGLIFGGWFLKIYIFWAVLCFFNWFLQVRWDGFLDVTHPLDRWRQEAKLITSAACYGSTAWIAGSWLTSDMYIIMRLWPGQAKIAWAAGCHAVTWISILFIKKLIFLGIYFTKNIFANYHHFLCITVSKNNILVKKG